MLAAQLGLDSIEELEAVIDSMEGISPDGTEMEGDNLAREARVRSAYLDWCKEFGKTADEGRFPQFMSNFLEMEEFASESGKEMVLNEYADFTEAEYTALAADQEGEDTTASSAVAAAKVEKEGEDAAAAKAEADREAAARAAAVKAEREAAAKAAADKKAAALAEQEAKASAVKAEAEKKRRTAEEAKRKQLAEAGE